MRSAPRSEPVGEAQEIHLVDGVEHLDEGAARWRILSSSVAMPSGRSRPCAFSMYALRDRLARYAPLLTDREQSLEVLFQVLPRRRPTSPRRSPVQPRGGSPE